MFPSKELPGPSSLGRVAACVTSEALEHFVNAPHEFTRLGDVMHEFLKIAFERDRKSALVWAYLNHRHLLEALELTPFERLPPPQEGAYTPEVSFAYHVERGTCRVLGHGLNRNEARALAREGEIVGTADLAAMESGGGVLIVDWKTGWKPVDPAFSNWQLKTYMLMAARAVGAKSARCAIIRVLWNGQVPPWDWAEMDEDELADHAAALRILMRERARVLQVVERIGRATGPVARRLKVPKVVVGTHCEYCPALRKCPAHIRLVATLAKTDGLAALTPEQLGRAYRELERREKALRLVKAWFYATARQDPIPLGGGEMLGVKLRKVEVIVPELAEAVLAEMFTPDVAKVIISKSVVTKSTLTQNKFHLALKDYAMPTLPEVLQKITVIKRDAMSRLRASGALSAKHSKPVVKYRPGKLDDDNTEDFDEDSGADEAA